MKSFVKKTTLGVVFLEVMWRSLFKCNGIDLTAEVKIPEQHRIHIGCSLRNQTFKLFDCPLTELVFLLD